MGMYPFKFPNERNQVVPPKMFRRTGSNYDELAKIVPKNTRKPRPRSHRKKVFQSTTENLKSEGEAAVTILLKRMIEIGGRLKNKVIGDVILHAKCNKVHLGVSFTGPTENELSMAVLGIIIGMPRGETDGQRTIGYVGLVEEKSTVHKQGIIDYFYLLLWFAIT